MPLERRVYSAEAALADSLGSRIRDRLLLEGSRLRGTVRTDVACDTTNYYSGDWIDELTTDPTKQYLIVRASAYAIGRKTDELIIGQLSTSRTITDSYDDVLTRERVLVALDMLTGANVSDDSPRFAVVGWKQWGDLSTISDFANAPVVRLHGVSVGVRYWLGTFWMPHSGLPSARDTRSCYLYRRSAVCHTLSPRVETTISWHDDRCLYFVLSAVGQGARLIDQTGVVTLRCRDI